MEKRNYWFWSLMAIVVVGFLITVSLAFANKSQDIDLLWKARALKAVENIEVMTEKLQKKDSEKL